MGAFYGLGCLSSPTGGGGMNTDREKKIARFQTYSSDFKNVGSESSIRYVLTSGHKRGGGKAQSWGWSPGVTDPGRFLEVSHLCRGLAPISRDFFSCSRTPFF